jgi:Acetyltransferases
VSLVIAVAETADAAVRDLLVKGILHAGEQKAGPPELRPLVVVLSDPDTGSVVGGLWGRTSWAFLVVELLFVPEACRGQGIGARLLQTAEEEAMRRGCHGAWLDTFSFQAPEFYRRQGYTLFGTIENYPPGYARHFFRKHLVVTG